MDAAGILAKFEQTHATWRGRLGPLSDEDVARVPEGGGWCVGRICHHLGSVSDMLLGNAERCAAGDGEDKGFQFQPWMITVVGSLPPTRIHVPDLPPDLNHLANPEPLTKDEGLARLDGMHERMRTLQPRVQVASKRCRREHPVGGWLNAREWYHMNEMHLRHHLRQFARLGF